MLFTCVPSDQKQAGLQLFNVFLGVNSGETEKGTGDVPVEPLPRCRPLASNFGLSVFRIATPLGTGTGTVA